MKRVLTTPLPNCAFGSASVQRGHLGARFGENRDLDGGLDGDGQVTTADIDTARVQGMGASRG